MTGRKSSFPHIEHKDLGNGNFLHLINIQEIDSKLEEFIDQNIVRICEGKTETDIPTIKQRLIDYLTPKRGSTLEMGAVAEFFTHLYLVENGFNQEFLFLNLEGDAIKKGFDGYYSLDNDQWIYESKSGNLSTSGVSHPKKIKESYDDLKNKISGNVKNNPWQNAYNHARHGDVGSAEGVYKNLKKLSEEFTNKKFKDIKDFNIIPGSTIFMENNWQETDFSILEQEIVNLVSTFNFKKINVICLNKKAVDLFWEYVNKK